MSINSNKFLRKQFFIILTVLRAIVSGYVNLIKLNIKLVCIAFPCERHDQENQMNGKKLAINYDNSLKSVFQNGFASQKLLGL